MCLGCVGKMFVCFGLFLFVCVSLFRNSIFDFKLQARFLHDENIGNKTTHKTTKQSQDKQQKKNTSVFLVVLGVFCVLSLILFVCYSIIRNLIFDFKPQARFLNTKNKGNK